MRKKNHMNQIIMVGILILAGLVAILFVKNRFGSRRSATTAIQDKNDLVLINDLNDAVSVEYTKDEKKVSSVLKPNDQMTNGKGFIKVFVAGKGGSYDVDYSYPRPLGSTEQVRVSQVLQAVRGQEKVTSVPDGDSILNEKGMVGDVKVSYEEILTNNL
jgi:hypothetical protein